jgi:hypothetical protein
MSPLERTLAGRSGAHKSWAMTEDRTARTEAARQAADARFEKQVDPDGVLTPQERSRRAKQARAAFFAQIQLKSAQTRRKRATNP